jgi:hypothetical protein
MGPLATYIFSAMISWIPISEHTFTGESVEDITSRYEMIAETVEKAALDPNREPLITGEDGRIKTALLLASIASFESQFGRDVVTCHRIGDNGVAYGPWQTHLYNRAKAMEACTDLNVMVSLAYDMIKRSFDHCQRVELLDKLTIYTSGGRCIHERGQSSRYRIGRALWYYNHHQGDTLSLKEHMIDWAVQHE